MNRFLKRFRRQPIADTIDLTAPAIARDPFPHYEELRVAGSVQYLARHDAWIVLDYDEVQDAFARPERFSSQPYAEIDRVLLGADPPDHGPVRRVVSRCFSSEALKALSAFAEEKAVALLRPRMDAVAGYAVPLSEAVAARLLGFDDDAVRAIRSAPLEVASRIRVLDELAGRALLYEQLLADGIDDLRARSLIRLLWLAATTTTERVIAYGVLRLLQNAAPPGGDQVPAFVDEVLRLHPPELLVPRLTTGVTRLGEVELPANAVVHLCVGAANRDPAKFENPAALRIDRPPVRHFTFGSGIHHCVGAALGRRVVETSVRVLLTHAPGLRAAQPLENLVGWCSMTANPIARLLVEGAR